MKSDFQFPDATVIEICGRLTATKQHTLFKDKVKQEIIALFTAFLAKHLREDLPALISK